MPYLADVASYAPALEENITYRTLYENHFDWIMAYFAQDVPLDEHRATIRCIDTCHECGGPR